MYHSLVIFDCDGVLVDSEPICNGVLARALAEIGLHLSLADVIERFVGRSWPDSIGIIERELGGSVPPDFESRFQSRLIAALEADLRPIPGVPEVLDRLRVPICVASNSQPLEIRSALLATG